MIFNGTIIKREEQLMTVSHFSNVSAEEMLYTEAELTASMPKIETINFHQVNMSDSIHKSSIVLLSS